MGRGPGWAGHQWAVWVVFPSSHSRALGMGLFMTQAATHGQELRQPLQPPHSKLLSRVQLPETPWTSARQASMTITNSQSLPKLMSKESVMPSNHLILCHTLLLLPSIFPSILKSRDIILPTKVHLVKAMVFPVVMYGCESWTIKLRTKEF